MIEVDEEALICDLAETYNIYDYKSLPMTTVATFSIGLRENSRIKLKLNGQKYPLETLLLASVCDKLGLLIWSKSKDAASGRNKPDSIVEKLLNIDKERDFEVFESPEAFEEAMRIINSKEEET